MKETEFSDKLSIFELLLLLSLLVCYAVTLYFLITNQRSFLILFFVLHSCLSIVLMLMIHDRMKQELLSHADHTARQLEEEVALLAKYKDDLQALKNERDTLLDKQTQLTEAQQDAKKQIRSLHDALENEKQTQKLAQSASSLNHLLPKDENPVNLNIIETANRVMEEMMPYSRQSGVQLTLSCTTDTLMVRADANFIRILFRNIIDNSIKYMGRNGSLVTTISNIGEDLFIVLKDNGEGLPSNETPHIFELNYQGSNRISGNGLGLAQAKAIVEYYGGTIYAKSESGNGMGIYIQLPARSRRLEEERGGLS